MVQAVSERGAGGLDQAGAGCPGSRPAAVTAPPRVPRAAASAAGGVPAGAEAARVERYAAMPMLPSTAMPSAPPNSDVVSATAAAAPARSGGTAPMISSLPIG